MTQAQAMSWTERARAYFLKTAPPRTDETPETLGQADAVFSETGPPPTDKTDETKVSRVSSVRPQAVLEKTSLASACTNCRHRLPPGTCAEPEAAGLIPAGEGFGIAWPPEGHAAGCPAYSLATPPEPQDRPHRLSQVESDVAHAQPWDEAACGRFAARVGLFLRRGIGATDADDLAERLHLRDVRGDDRWLCVECQHWRPGRCGNYRQAGLVTSEISGWETVLQRCPGHKEIVP